jgi:hypothetical protein
MELLLWADLFSIAPLPCSGGHLARSPLASTGHTSFPIALSLVRRARLDPPFSLPLSCGRLALFSLSFLSPLRFKPSRAPPPPPPFRAKSRPQEHSTTALALHPCHLSSLSHRSPPPSPSTERRRRHHASAPEPLHRRHYHTVRPHQRKFAQCHPAASPVLSVKISSRTHHRRPCHRPRVAHGDQPWSARAPFLSAWAGQATVAIGLGQICEAVGRIATQHYSYIY